jgi:hypothetical protein
MDKSAGLYPRLLPMVLLPVVVVWWWWCCIYVQE